MAHNNAQALEPYSPSLEDFCRFLESYGQQTDSPQNIAALWESQAEALRISRKDANVENLDLLLNTMLNTLQHISETQEQKRWTNRVRALFRRRTARNHQPGYAPATLLQA